ncbi:MAG: hypothetical protein JW702_05060 [Clostridiales bacterium]|nr:hypothetical protein [Clostridiales bacterium]
MKTKMFILFIVTVLAFSACSKKSEVPVSMDEAVFNVEVSDGDIGGIDLETEFIITSSEEVNLDLIENSVKVYPEIEYKITKKSSNEFTLKPKEPLLKNQVYKIEIKSEEQDYDFSWAFQTKKDLMVVSSIPASMSSYVPINSGIEIVFNNRNVVDFEKYFHIEPQVDGKFTSNGYSKIFIPDQLEYNTVYNVTIDKELGVDDSDLILNEDYDFSFTTESTGDELFVYLNDLFFNFTSTQNHFIPAYISQNGVDKEYEVSIFEYEMSDDFLHDIKSYDEINSFNKLYEEIPTYLSELYAFNTKPVQVEYGYSSFYSFEFPDSLEQGYYLARITLDDKKYYAFIQVNDLLVYASQFESNEFFWVVDSNNNEGVKNAKITLDDNSNGLTDSDGIVNITGVSADIQNDKNYAKITATGFYDFIMRNVNAYGPYNYYDPYFQSTSNNYWKYIFTDRGTYLPTDEMNIFGYVKPKSGSTGDYTLSLYSNVNGVKLLDSKEIQTTNTGTFTDTFAWEELTPGWYNLILKEKDIPIVNYGFYINPYTKPTYKIEGDFDKKYISAGESITYNMNAGFFDGTPVSRISFNYYMYLGDQTQGFVVTDESGNAGVDLKPYYETTSWRPISAQIEVSNRNAEDYRISDYDYFIFLPKNKMVELDYDKQNSKLNIMAHELDAKKFSVDFNFQYEDLRGNPLDTSLNVSVTEVWYEKVEKGQVYDYINKVTKKDFDYVRRTKVVEDKIIETKNGRYDLLMPYVFDSDSTFEINVTLEEENGQRIVETMYINDNYYPWVEMFSDYYAIKLKDNDYSYKVNEKVDYYLENSGIKEEKLYGKFLLMYLQDGLMKYEFIEGAEGSFNYIEEYRPNIMVQGIYVKEGKFVETAYPTSILYDYSEKEISIDVESDKEEYQPGEWVTLDIQTKDSDGELYPAEVNISVVDEAYFNLYSQSVDILGAIYAGNYGTGIMSEFNSSNHTGNIYGFGGAEGGGPEGDYYLRSDLKDTAIFETIKTDINGNGGMTFKLPDNLTSWRITYQGINDKMEAKSSFFNISSKLPFYISTISSDYYLTSDNPSISIRVFGDEAVKGSKVSYKIVLVNEEINDRKEFNQEGVIGEFTNLSLGILEKGQYTIKLFADNGKYNDALEEKFVVVDSAVTFNNKKYYKINEKTHFDPVYSVAQVTFFNENKSKFYNSLLDLRYLEGQRVDQILAGMSSRKLIKEILDPDILIEEASVLNYQDMTGGIKLLPYSESDAIMSARIALLGEDYFDNDDLKKYFYGILYDRNSDLKSVVAAYTGLAALGQPVLTDIYQLQKETTLDPMEDILLALGLQSLGDKKGASEIFNEIIEGYVIQTPDLKINISTDDGQNFLSTALLAVLSLKIGNIELGDLLFEHNYDYPSKYDAAYIEKYIYLENRDIMNDDEIKNLTGNVKISYASEKENLNLFGFEMKTVILTPAELEKLKIESVEGNVGAYVYAWGDENDMKNQKTDEYNLTRVYSVNNEQKSEFEVSELIKVTLTPGIKKGGEDSYQITDFIPAGFRFVKIDKSTVWYDEEGQKIIFYYWNNEKNSTIDYYIQAVMPGKYTADYAVITQIGETGNNFTEQIELTVK